MNRRDFTLDSAAALATVALGVGHARAAEPEPAIGRAARELHRRAIVLDCNLAPPAWYTVTPPGWDPEQVTAASVEAVRRSGLTVMKLTLGGFNAPFEETLAEVGAVQRLIEGRPDVFTQIRRIEEIEAAKASGKLGIIFSFESAAALEDKLDRINVFRALGVRVMQLAYNMPAPFGAGVLSPPDSTLTDLGRQAIARMNELGVAVDLSHANSATAVAAMQASKKPVLMTHGGCAAIHRHPRNKTDADMRALAQRGGVFGIYDLFYLAPSPRQPNLDDYMAHMTHALEVCGEDHVGIGSDASFDTLDVSAAARERWDKVLEARRASGMAAPEEDRMPFTEGLNRADRTLVIADALLRRGYPARVVEKVLGANFVRAFREIW
ncbi:MAG TPA: membrane dipeptidase [Steroidobacteraceae bacterium]|nr:membrane dipeptidase [Steroidobacteraceae bacterium]